MAFSQTAAAAASSSSSSSAPPIVAKPRAPGAAAGQLGGQRGAVGGQRGGGAVRGAAWRCGGAARDARRGGGADRGVDCRITATTTCITRNCQKTRRPKKVRYGRTCALPKHPYFLLWGIVYVCRYVWDGTKMNDFSYLPPCMLRKPAIFGLTPLSDPPCQF